MSDLPVRMSINAPAADRQASAHRSPDLSADFQAALHEADTSNAGNKPLLANIDAGADKPGEHPETAAEHDAMWDSRARQVLDGYGRAQLPRVRQEHIHPSQPTTERGPKWHEFAKELNGLFMQYDEDFRYQTPGIEAQKEYIDKALDIFSRYEANPDAQLSEMQREEIDDQRAFLDAEKRVLDEMATAAPEKREPPGPNSIAPANSEDGEGHSGALGSI